VASHAATSFTNAYLPRRLGIEKTGTDNVPRDMACLNASIERYPKAMRKASSAIKGSCAHPLQYAEHDILEDMWSSRICGVLNDGAEEMHVHQLQLQGLVFTDQPGWLLLTTQLVMTGVRPDLPYAENSI